jgi:hypothetical protein
LTLEWKIPEIQRGHFTVGPKVKDNDEDRLKDMGKSFGFGRAQGALSVGLADIIA